MKPLRRSRSIALLARLGLIGSALWLAGCTAMVGTRVTRFQAWPADAAGATFAFAPHAADQGKELEQSTYQAYVREELEQLGLRAAPAGQAGRFLVEVDAEGSQRTVRSLQPVYQNYRVFIPPRPGPGGTMTPGYWSADMAGGQYLGDREVARTLQVSRLRVQLRDRSAKDAAAASVYEATAVYEGGMENLPDLVPYLAKAAFDGFPGRNGETRELRYERAPQPAAVARPSVDGTN